MIEKTGPTIYRGESIYNTGAGGNIQGVKFFTDFSKYDGTNDLPYIGNSYEIPSDTHTTVSKLENGLRFKNADNTNNSYPYRILFENTSSVFFTAFFKLVYDDSSFIWIHPKIALALGSSDSNLTIFIDDSLNYSISGLTLKGSAGSYKIFYINNSGKGPFCFRSKIDNGKTNLYVNNVLNVVVNGIVEFNYVNPSPRKNGIVELINVFCE